MNNNDQKFMAEKIRSEYIEKTTRHTELDELRALDAKVKGPANIFAYVYGTVGALVMGSGMSLVMTDIGNMIGMKETMVPGTVIGIVGMAIALTNYPIYKRVLASRRKKYADEILSLSESVMKDEI